MTPRTLSMLALIALSFALSGCAEEKSAADPHHGHAHGPNGQEVARIEGTDYWIETKQIADEAMLIVWLLEGPVVSEAKPWDSQSLPVLNLASDGNAIQIEGQQHPDVATNAYKFVHEAFQGHVHGASISVRVGDAIKTVDLPHSH